MSNRMRLATVGLFSIVILLMAPPRASASGCDLYSVIATCTFAANDAIYTIDATHPTGTGVVDSFLRVQQKGSEQGFNTSARPMTCDGLVCDDITDPNFTRNLLTSSIPTVTIDGKTYRQFFLDINEDNGKGNLLTLDQLEIYVSNTAGLNTHSTGSGIVGAAQVYRLDTTNKDNWLNLDYSLVSGGSGSGDMVAYILDTGQFTGTYTYLYSQFGCTSCGSGGNTKYPSQAGFEEWWVKGSPDNNTVAAVPEPASLVLFATGLVGVASRWRRAKGRRIDS